MPDRLKVGQQPLKLFILVRFQVWQQMTFINKKIKLIFIIVVLIILIIALALYSKQLSPTQKEWMSVNELPAGYEMPSDYHFSFNNNVVSCRWEPILEADIATFEVSNIANRYARDKNHAYICGHIISNMDPANFVVLNDNYTKDLQQVVWNGYEPLPDADPETFEVILLDSVFYDGNYAKDKNNVYNVYSKLPNADPKTFTLVPATMDKDWIYSYDNTVLGPVSLIADNAQYSESLPSKCDTEGLNKVHPSIYPPTFSNDYSVVGYLGDSNICVIDKNENTIQLFPYGTFNGSASLSADGSKVLFYKYQNEGAAYAGEICPECGQYSLDRKTGEVEKIKN